MAMVDALPDVHDVAAGELAAAGRFRLLVPRALGGLELDPLAAADVVEAASRVDGSLGWSVMIGSQSAWIASFLPGDVAAEVVGRPTATVAGALKPGGRATPGPDGYRVSGRWGTASGISWAEHVYGTCVADDGLRIAFVPVAAVEVEDTWRTAGLRATASHDFRLDDVAVPREWTLPFPHLRQPEHDGPLYRHRWMNVIFVLQAAQALGVARGAVDDFGDLAATTTRLGSTAPLREQPTVQAAVAQVEASVRSARAWLREVVAETWESMAERPPTDEQKVLVRLAITSAVRVAAQAAGVLHEAAGAAAVYEDHPLHRRFQDLRAASAHVQATPVLLELTGAALLGAPVSPLPGLL